MGKALREVQEHSGRQFCPAAVELSEQLWDAGVLAGGYGARVVSALTELIPVSEVLSSVRTPVS